MTKGEIYKELSAILSTIEEENSDIYKQILVLRNKLGAELPAKAEELSNGSIKNVLDAIKKKEHGMAVLLSDGTRVITDGVTIIIPKTDDPLPSMKFEPANTYIDTTISGFLEMARELKIDGIYVQEFKVPSEDYLRGESGKLKIQWGGKILMKFRKNAFLEADRLLGAIICTQAGYCEKGLKPKDPFYFEGEQYDVLIMPFHVNQNERFPIGLFSTLQDFSKCRTEKEDQEEAPMEEMEWE